MASEKIAREMYDERWGQELGALGEQVAAEVDADRASSLRFSEALEGERAAVGQSLASMQGDLEDAMRSLSPSRLPGPGRGPPEELANLKRDLREEKEGAAQLLGGLEAGLFEELRGLEELLALESAGREQARASIAGSMQEAASKVREAAQECTQEREMSHEKLLTLLEATCTKMERHLPG